MEVGDGNAVDAASETVTVVHHLDIVNAYYKSFRVAPASLRFPRVAYIKPSTNAKKRKRASVAKIAPVAMRLPPADLLSTLEAARLQVLPQVQTLLPQYVRTGSDSPATDTSQSSSGAFMDGMQQNDSDEDAVIMHDKRQFLLPRRSSFFLGDVFHLPRLPSHYRCIVMDPPWENKTVARGAKYATMPHTRLIQLDVPAMAHPDGALLAIWVTNKPAYHDFIVDELLPHWGFSYLQTWHWLKVAADGDCVTPLSSSHKLPFEKVLVAGSGVFATLSVQPRVLVSVPLRHSWKPPLLPVLAGYGIDNEVDAKIEIFARELRPHWTCVGNEVLKFQDLSLFDLEP